MVNLSKVLIDLLVNRSKVLTSQVQHTLWFTACTLYIVHHSIVAVHKYESAPLVSMAKITNLLSSQIVTTLDASHCSVVTVVYQARPLALS